MQRLTKARNHCNQMSEKKDNNDVNQQWQRHHGIA